MTVQPLLCPSIAKALGSPVEVSLRALLNEYGVTEGDRLLEGLATLHRVFDHYKVSCIPTIGRGGLEDPRVLSVPGSDSLDAILTEIAALESADVEFKSSLQVDRKRLLHDPGRSPQDYRSDEVLKAALKTVAAFANSGGGTLYIGVEDDGSRCGLKEDFAAANPKKADYDGWDLHFRNLVGSRLSDGGALSAYIHTQLFEHEGSSFVRVRITPRSRLTFLKTGDLWELFVRAGTQTNSIPYCDIEQHFVLARLY